MDGDNFSLAEQFKDHSRIRKDNAPENMGVIRHMALNVLRGAPNAKKSSPSNNIERQRAAMDNRYLEEVMRGAGLGNAEI